MSCITEILICGARKREIDSLNEWIRENDERGQQFRLINMDAAGGLKYYTSSVWAAAFNYGPLELLDKLRDPATWGISVLSIAVVIKDEETDEAFVFDEVDKGYGPVVAQEFRL